MQRSGVNAERLRELHLAGGGEIEPAALLDDHAHHGGDAAAA